MPSLWKTSRTRENQATRLILLILAASALWSNGAPAEADVSLETAKSFFSSDSYGIEGEIGSFGELYKSSREDSQRPGSSGRLFLRPRIILPADMSVDFDFLISTEGNAARQEINQFEIKPSWRWGAFHLGDYTQSYSPFTLGGIKIRGGAVDISPWKLRISFFGGRAQKGIVQDDRVLAYERNIYGGRLGIGSEAGSHFHVIALKASDELASGISGSFAADSTADSLVQSPPSVTPQENLVLSAISAIHFGERRLVWENEISGSAHSRDIRSDELESDRIPTSLRDVFTPRTSSHADYALSSSLLMRVTKVSIGVKYKYIGPGYVSLGLPANIGDLREVGANLGFSIGRMRVRLDGWRQSDNLAQQKQSTTYRHRLGSVLSFQPAKRWSSGLAANFTNMKNDAAGTERVDFFSLNLSSNQSFSFGKETPLRSLGLNYTYQMSREGNRLRAVADLDSHSASLQSSLAVHPELRLTPSIQYRLLQSAGMAAKHTQSYEVAAHYSGFGHGLSTAVSGTLVRESPDSKSLVKGSLSVGLSLSSAMSVKLELDSAKHKEGSEGFMESTARLSATHSF